MFKMKLSISLLLLSLSNNIPISYGNDDQLRNLIKYSGCTFTYVHYLTPGKADVEYSNWYQPYYRTTKVTYLDFARRELQVELGLDVTYEIADEAHHRKQRFNLSRGSMKFANCRVQLVKASAAVTHLFLGQREKRFSLPDFVLILRHLTIRDNYFLPTSKGHVSDQVIPTVILSTINFGQVFIICVSCSRRRGRVVQIPIPDQTFGKTSISYIRNQWSSIQMNLSRLILATNSEVSKLGRRCSLATHFEGKDCVYQLLGERTNAKLNAFSRFTNAVDEGFPLKSRNIHAFEKENRKYFHHGIHEEQNQLVVVDRSPLSFRGREQLIGILKPFVSAMLNILIYVVISITGNVILKRIESVEGSHFNFRWLLGSLAEKSIDFVSTTLAKNRSKFPLIMLWGLWLVALVDLKLHRGTIVSLWSLQSHPPVPDTFESLVQSGMTIGAKITCTYYGTKDDCWQYDSFTESVGDTDKTLHDRVISLANDYPYIYSKMILNATALIRSGRNEKSRKLPQVFALIDTPLHIYYYRRLLPEYAKSWVSEGTVMSALNKRSYYWVVYDNYMGPTFSQMLAGIYQGGLFQRWAEAEGRKKKADMELSVLRKMHERWLTMPDGSQALVVPNKEAAKLRSFDAMVRRKHLYCLSDCSGVVVGMREEDSLGIAGTVQLQICFVWLCSIYPIMYILVLELIIHYGISGMAWKYLGDSLRVIREIFGQDTNSNQE